MRVRVLFFGQVARTLECDALDLELPGEGTVGQVNISLAERWPSHSALLRTARLAVNARFASPDAPLADGDEIAVIELVGGG